MRIHNFILFAEFLIVLTYTSGTHAQVFANRVQVPGPRTIFEHQPSPTTCWAACDAMLLKSQNVKISAKEIVIKKFGLFDASQDQSAGAELSMPAAQLEGTWTNKAGGTINITTTISLGSGGRMSENDVRALIDSLSAKKPVVIATRQHGRVCVGADYIDAPLGPLLISMTFLNPNFSAENALNSVSTEQIASQFQIEGGYLGMITIDASSE